MSELNLWMNYSFKNIFNLAPRMWSFSKKMAKRMLKDTVFSFKECFSIEHFTHDAPNRPDVH